MCYGQVSPQVQDKFGNVKKKFNVIHLAIFDGQSSPCVMVRSPLKFRASLGMSTQRFVLVFKKKKLVFKMNLIVVCPVKYHLPLILLLLVIYYNIFCSILCLSIGHSHVVSGAPYIVTDLCSSCNRIAVASSVVGIDNLIMLMLKN